MKYELFRFIFRFVVFLKTISRSFSGKFYIIFPTKASDCSHNNQLFGYDEVQWGNIILFKVLKIYFRAVSHLRKFTWTLFNLWSDEIWIWKYCFRLYLRKRFCAKMTDQKLNFSEFKTVFLFVFPTDIYYIFSDEYKNSARCIFCRFKFISKCYFIFSSIINFTWVLTFDIQLHELLLDFIFIHLL